MMRYLLFFTILFCSVISAPAAALLPPYFESAREITSLLNDLQISEIITSARIIQSIIKTETGYTITTVDNCTLTVNVRSLPQKEGFVGPANIKIEPGEMSCQSP